MWALLLQGMAGMTAFRSARLALFHGWTASPLWQRTGSEIGNLDLTELPVSDGLRQRLRDWTARCDEILSAHAYQWHDAHTHKAIVAQGSALATELRAELGIEIGQHGSETNDVTDPLPHEDPPAGLFDPTGTAAAQ